MAASGYKLFVTGDVLTAAQVNDYLMLQTVMVFANSAARTSALSGVLAEGLVSYLKDTDVVEVYTGAAWVSLDDPNAIQNSIVDAKGDIITATADNTPSRLAVGNNGETLVADSSTSTGLRYQGSAIGKNGVFNSCYDVFQRTSAPTTGITTAGGVAYTIDRWVSWAVSGTGSMQTSQQVTGDTTNLPFVRYCARVQRTAANTSTSSLVLGQALENTDSARFIGQTVVFSFYARKGTNYSSASNGLTALVQTGTGTDQSYWNMTGTSAAINTTFTLTSTWQRFQGTATLSASGTQVGFSFAYNGVGTAGAADYFEVTGVQLELGSIATPYAKMGGGTIQGELAACQRYYYQVATGNTQPLGAAWTDSTTQGQIMIPFPVTMRTSPSLVQVAGTNYYNINTANSGKLLNSFTGLNLVSTTMTTIYGTVSGATAGQGGYSYTANASASIAFSAEL